MTALARFWEQQACPLHVISKQGPTNQHVSHEQCRKVHQMQPTCAGLSGQSSSLTATHLQQHHHPPGSS